MSFYPEMCGLCFSKPSAHVTEEGLFICGPCHKSIEAIKKESPNVVDRKRKDPSALCCKCGICCVVLSAKVEDEEAKKFHQQALNDGIGPQNFGDVFTLEEIGPHSGDLVFRFPCEYLRGKTLDFVSCAGYHLDRPAVCRSYLCKVAIKYSLGLITIEEAQFTLRSSFLSGHLDLFNWTHPTGDDPDALEQEVDEQKLIFYNHLNEQAQRMIESGAPRDLVGMVVSAQITPVLDFKNAACHVLFNMHMQAFDREYIEPRVYIEADEVDSWPPEKQVFATQIIRQVLAELRDLFATKNELAQIEGERDGQSRRSQEQSGRDGGQASEEEQAEAGDSGDDVDLGGREGVQHSGQHPEGARAGEGSGDTADAAGEQDQRPAPGDGDGLEGARQEGGERRVDPVRVACCREPKLRGGRCDNCGQWSEEAELKPVDVLQGNPNRQIIEDIMGMIAENCTCPGECPVHDDPRDKEPFDLESDGVDDLDFGLEEDDG